MTPLEEDVAEIKTSVAVLASQMTTMSSTMSEIKVDLGKRSEDPTIKLWIKECVLKYLGPDAWRDSAPPEVPTVWASLTEKQRTTVVGSIVGIITTGAAVLTMIATNL